MTQELNLAQNLARTLMKTVILFKVDDDEYGVLPAGDLDDGKVDALYHYDPYTAGQPVH